MNDLKVFAYGGQQIRTVIIDEEPWWVLADVCKVLGLTNSRAVAARLDDDEKNTVTLTDGIRGNPRVNVVNESGLYSVILRSDKSEAKEFKRWVTHEVLPSIRKTGSYTAPTWTPPNPVPVSVPVMPELPADARLKRAELLIRAAEHPALPREEQLRLLNRAAIDLTGMGVKSPEIGAECFPASVPDGSQFPRTFTSTNNEEVE